MDFQAVQLTFGLVLPQAEVDVDVFVDNSLGMTVDGNIGQQVLKLNTYIYGLKQKKGKLVLSAKNLS